MSILPIKFVIKKIIEYNKSTMARNIFLPTNTVTETTTETPQIAS